MRFIEATQISPDGLSTALTIVNSETIAVVMDSADTYDMLGITSAPIESGSVVLTHANRAIFFAENYSFWKNLLTN